MGRRWNETMPPAVRSRASASVTNRWCSANATSRAIMTVAFLGPARMTHAWPGGVWEPPAVPAADQDGGVRRAAARGWGRRRRRREGGWPGRWDGWWRPTWGWRGVWRGV